MRKGVEVTVRVYLEGDAAPADDFGKIGKRVVAEALRLGFAQIKDYKMAIRSLRVDDDPPDEEVTGDFKPLGEPPASTAKVGAEDAPRWQFWRR